VSQILSLVIRGRHMVLVRKWVTDDAPTAKESFNSRLKAEGDEESTNLYISNLPKSLTEAVSPLSITVPFFLD
jgi:hypothetical protein